ncbi:hypothetical protein NX059_008389 [Plenodomus lindquistii]|nr:hypothetical protein NX059_008389 [Plenodomus lindquistii]
MSQFKVGQTVETATGQKGVVKYVGSIHFASGIYVGIELATADGKNDGSVRGQRYFTCEEDHGLFVKSTGNLRVVAPPRPAVAPAPASSSRSVPTTTTTTTTTNTRTRPSSVIAPPQPSRTAAHVRRQSVAVSTAPQTRAPHRVSSTGNSSANNVEVLQTKIRHLERQHAEDQDGLRELASTKEERDRYQKLLEKVQNKCQSQHAELQDLKENLRNTQNEYETLIKANEDQEINLEDALVDREMAQLRAENAEADLESLRAQLQERTEEVEVLREEAELYTAEMTEEERQDAGYYTLQNENERIRDALVRLRDMTEATEQELRDRISSLESDLTDLDTYRRDNDSLRERLAQADAIIEDLRQRLDAANEMEDMVTEVSNQNHDLQDRIAEQNLHIQDLENLRELNDELEVQHLEQEEELRAELETREIEVAEQARHIAEQTAIIADHETLISKFRDLVVDLQNKAMYAESSKTMTEAMVRDTTGKFNEVMDVNRQLRAATVQSTARKIDHDIADMELTLSRQETRLWSDGTGGDFIKGEANQAYFVTIRLDTKCTILTEALSSTQKQISHGGRLDDVFSQLNICEATMTLNHIKDRNSRLQTAMQSISLAQFTEMGSIYQDLLALEQSLDEGLNSVKADTINFDELPGSLTRSNKTYEAILLSQQEILLTRPENEVIARATTFESRLLFVKEIFAVLFSTLSQVPDSIQQQIASVEETLRAQTDEVSITYERARKFAETLRALRGDGLYCPMTKDDQEELAEFEESITTASDETCKFARNLIAEIIMVSTSSPSDTVDDSVVQEAQRSIERLQAAQSCFIMESRIGPLSFNLDLWINHVSSLILCVEIPQVPTPWAQKAKLRNDAVKLREELGKQLDDMRAERRTTLLKIHEREEIIATKDLEIEHLLAKNRDAVAKTEATSALKSQIAELEAKIAELQEIRESQSQIIRDVDTEDMDDADLEARVEVEPLPTYSEPAESPYTRDVAVPGLKVMSDAIRFENHWLRQRGYEEQLRMNKQDFYFKFGGRREDIPYWNALGRQAAEAMARLVEEDTSDEDETDSLSTPISLPALDGNTNCLKEAIEARARVTIIVNDDDEDVFV